MDSDDAVDMLEELDEEEEKSKILAMLDEEAGEDVKVAFCLMRTMKSVV